MRPFTHSMEEFFENRFPSRWMEGFFEPEVWRWPFGGDVEHKFDVFPKIDIMDKEDALIVRAEMPGIKKEDLDISIAGDRLTVEAEREFKEEQKKDEFYRHEMAYGRLYRTIRLPVEVLADEAKAELKDGILEVHLPKVEATLPHKVNVA
jgi:HSP20 family protein